MGNLSLLSAGSTSGGASPADGPDLADGGAGGYASDDFVQGSSSASRERKKGQLPPDLSLPLPSNRSSTRYRPMQNPRQ